MPDIIIFPCQIKGKSPSGQATEIVAGKLFSSPENTRNIKSHVPVEEPDKTTHSSKSVAQHFVCITYGNCQIIPILLL